MPYTDADRKTILRDTGKRSAVNSLQPVAWLVWEGNNSQSSACSPHGVALLWQFISDRYY